MSAFVLSLFPGIGMLDSAFEQEGFCVVRGPDVLWGGDIRRFQPPAGKFDGVIGGPPCQMFSSLARLVEANGHKPRFGNLIPEFERCIMEAQPAWFLMENVRQAPEPAIASYGVKSFLLDNSWLPDSEFYGHEQRRLRRFCFGMRGVVEPPSLLRWIDLAVFTLPDASPTLTQWTPDNSKGAKCRKTAVNSGHSDPNCSLTFARRVRKRPVVSNVGGFTDGSKKPKHSHEPVTGGHDRPPSVRSNAVTGSDSGQSGMKPMRRYKLSEALRLQGLPADFLSDAPFTADGKLKAVANGVPIPVGRAVARAVRECLAMIEAEAQRGDS